MARSCDYILCADDIEGFNLLYPYRIQHRDSESLPEYVELAGHRIDWQLVSTAKEKSMPVVITGYCQFAPDYEPNLQCIRNWIVPTGRVLAENVRDSLVINWRLGDYCLPGRYWKNLEPEIVRSIINRVKPRRVLIVTDDPNSSFIEKLNFTGELEIVHGELQDDFCTVMAAHRVLISSSSFSWWAAFLGEAQDIYFPRLYNWAPWSVYFPGETPPGERLWCENDSRYHAVPNQIDTVLEFLKYFIDLSPQYRFRYLAHWRWMIKRLLTRSLRL